MKFSQMFMPTTKETPNDATLASHQYLIRGGFITQTGSGLYNFLPLGKIVLDKIRAVVKEEMDNTGANELLMSFVTPLELWEQSGRASVMGPELLKFKDRKGAGFVLSPTNEETVVDIVKNRITSYKDLPINLYHINTKFRDEARPRFGLMRGREFLMKDAYSFHATHEDLVREFHVMEDAYKKIYERLGLEYRVVAADSGAIGGSGSKEFMVLANSGEDTIVVCEDCEYGANIEAAVRAKKETKNWYDLTSENVKMEKVLTEGMKTIEDVSNFLSTPTAQSIKAVIKKAIYKDTEEVVVFFVRGNDELEETKAANAVDALELIDANEEDILNASLVAGFCGPFNLPKNLTYVIDNELKDEVGLVCGANEVDYHFTGTDLTTLKDAKYFDLIVVQEGDTCSCCGGKLIHTKGIEAGHIFQLGTKYSSAMDATFLDNNGKAQPFIMGCYGIGVSRLVAAVIEQNHDDKGCIWTKETAPFMVDVIVSNAKKEEELNAGKKIYNDLKIAGISTILDDRVNARFGFKMSDFELIGFPYAVVVGKKLPEGIVEIVNRKTLEKEEVSLDEVVNKLKKLK
ncbi:prolyl-tRNA synthetase [Arcobacter nitrofigilis DSM 7299]|uniref:Proline--tRNA ligase n=1 Tax=Arcobacter nitrofigilis (strain ATCC 33309 / DSM 7299 / CCUG 15893 / LMG 7604 / NCTC 12251 / CI) TaxID=572480 RepID=D5V279_ARCNC|nr:proline--tRNA ligase [Arcobacter nitrofigilis]ADG92312.1 prolyl-tRNA synthetase [Arcobacter nitrofigilis DSM 7299]